jgi:hypothetical protein
MQSAAHMIQVREPEQNFKEPYPQIRRIQGDCSLLAVREMPINEEKMPSLMLIFRCRATVIWS